MPGAVPEIEKALWKHKSPDFPSFGATVLLGKS